MKNARHMKGQFLFMTCVSSNMAVPELRRLVPGFPPLRPGFEASSGHVRSVVDKVTLEQVFSEYFGVPCQF
jgi:hypothetical protein